VLKQEAQLIMKLTILRRIMEISRTNSAALLSSLSLLLYLLPLFP